MGKKKSITDGGLVGGVLADGPRGADPAELEKIVADIAEKQGIPAKAAPPSGWVLKGKNGRFVNAEGFWVDDPAEAIRFSCEEHAQAHNKLHCEAQYEAVEV